MPGMQMNTRPPGDAEILGRRKRPALRLVGNRELAEMEEARKPQPVDTSRLEDALVAHVSRLWEPAKRAKTSKIEKEILEDYRQRNSEYDDDVLAEIRKQGGSEIYMSLTATKARSLEAWILDTLLPAGDPAFEITPTPVPDLGEEQHQQIQMQFMGEVQQAMAMGVMPTPEDMHSMLDGMAEEMEQRIKDAADGAADKMQTLIEDNLAEGGWKQAVSDAVYDFVATKACIIHGPTMRQSSVLEWVRNPATGRTEPQSKIVLRKHYERISPMDIYPSPDSRGPNDGYLFHRQRTLPQDLYGMKGAPGFSDEAIDTVMREHAQGGLREWMYRDYERAQIEQHDASLFDNTERRIDVLIYNGPIAGKILQSYGAQGVDDPLAEYEVRMWYVGQYVIGLRIVTTPARIRPYHVASMEAVPGSFWGYGLCYLIRDKQNMCNAAARAISNNAGIASGPQVVYDDIGRMPEGEQITSLYPWKAHQFNRDEHSSQNTRPPLSFMQPDMHVAELFVVYDKFSAMVDELVPSYMSGNQNISGAGRTASGLSMLMNQASKTVKRSITNFALGVITGAIELTWLMNMLYEDDESIKGDMTIQVTGPAKALIQEHQQVRRAEFLAATNNPTDMQIVGLGGRSKVLREIASGLGIDDVIPDEDSITSMQQQGEVQMQVEQAVSRIGQALGMEPEFLMTILQQGGLPNERNVQSEQIVQPDIEQSVQPATLDQAGQRPRELLQ